MRRRNVLSSRSDVLKIVKELDAFPKVPDTYQETSAASGGVSILVFIFIGVLVFSEINYYLQTELKFHYETDKTLDRNLKMNIDITVKMKCGHVGADVLDVTGQNADTFGSLDETAVHFDLTESQMHFHNMIRTINDYVKNEYHAIHHLLWTTGYMRSKEMPPRDVNTDAPKDGCRLNGTLLVNKVAGNFHIIAGKPVGFPGGMHAHLQAFGAEYNFSHRIDHFSFGELTPGIVNPLDGDLTISPSNMHIYQYYLQVVPTNVHTTKANVKTYQYSVTEQDRKLNHSAGSHGIAGIYFKYDLSPLIVTVTEEQKPYIQFIVRLCGIIGGVFATSGMVHQIVGFIFTLFAKEPKDNHNGCTHASSTTNDSLNNHSNGIIINNPISEKNNSTQNLLVTEGNTNLLLNNE